MKHPPEHYSPKHWDTLRDRCQIPIPARDSVTPSAVPARMSALILTPIPKAPKVALITSTPGYWGRLWLAIKGEL